MNSIQTMNRAADNIRILAAAMVEKAKSGHPGGAMGGADFINVLYSEYLWHLSGSILWKKYSNLDNGALLPQVILRYAISAASRTVPVHWVRDMLMP